MSNFKEKIENVYKIIEFYVNIIPTKIIYFLNELKIDQSYIFLSFFFIGIILRLIIHYIKNLNKKKDTYIYNKPDSAEGLYNIINNLTAINDNINKLNIENNNNNNNSIKFENNNNNIKEEKLNNNNDNVDVDFINEKITELENKIEQINDDIENNFKDNTDFIDTINLSQNDILEEINSRFPDNK